MIDLNDDGHSDFSFLWNLSNAYEVIPQAGLDGQQNEITTEPPRYGRAQTWPLNEGFLFSEILPDGTIWRIDAEPLIEWMIGAGGFQGFGSWRNAHEMFMGLRFDAADGIHYGWVRMSVYSEYDGATIHD